MNYSLRCFPSASNLIMPENSSSFMSNPYLCSEFTGSEFQPYITTIALYDDNDISEPIIVGKLPKPVRVSDSITMNFILRLDF